MSYLLSGDFEWGFIADLNRTIIVMLGLLLSARPWSASNNSVNTHQNENRVLAFESLISNAKVENK